jgi:hypothetical protein
MSLPWRLLLAVTIIGCVQGEVGAGFRMTWSVENAAGVEMSCQEAGGRLVEIAIVDSRGGRHSYSTACETMSFETESWDIATGHGDLSASLMTDEGQAISKVRLRSFDFAPGQLSNEIKNQRFVVEETTAREGPKVTWYWQLTDDAANLVQCDRIGTTFLKFTLDDAATTRHHLATLPCRSAAGFVTRVDEPVAEGTARFIVERLNRDQAVLGEHAFDTTVPEGLGDLELSVATIGVTPFVPGGSAGVTWQWRYNTEYFTDEQCAAMGIDYVKLWIWHQGFDGWWPDPRGLRLPCGAFDHNADNDIWGLVAYSGYYQLSFLDPGFHRLMLGFFRGADEGEPSDMLVAYDVPEALDSDNAVQLQRNEDTDHGINLLISDLSADTLPRTGALKIALAWVSSDEDLKATCTSAAISEMGFIMTSGGIPIAEMEYGVGRPCRDWIEFHDAPVLGAPYELTVYGISGETGLSYYARCEDITPEAGLSVDEADGYVCRINAQ